MLLGDDSTHSDLNGASETPKVTPRQNGGQGVKINLSSSEAEKKKEEPKEAKATVDSSHSFRACLCSSSSSVRGSSRIYDLPHLDLRVKAAKVVEV